MSEKKMHVHYLQIQMEKKEKRKEKAIGSSETLFSRSS